MNSLKGQCTGIIFMQSHLSLLTCFIMHLDELLNERAWSKWQNIVSSPQPIRAVTRCLSASNVSICDREQYDERAWQNVVMHAANAPLVVNNGK